MSHPKELAQEHWDFIVIGTGASGATAGFALAKMGKRVLFLEKGLSLIDKQFILCGNYAETFFKIPETPKPKHRSLLEKAGRYTEEITDRTKKKPRKFIPYTGSGTGGSTTIYGAVLERFQPSDFDRWPLDGGELTFYYEQAEKLYRVRELHLSPAGRELSNHLAEKGLHPYPLPAAHDADPDCTGCQGFICANHTKNDAAKICLIPALRDYGAALVDRCQVTRLEATKDRVTTVHGLLHHKIEIAFKADAVILAAGGP